MYWTLYTHNNVAMVAAEKIAFSSFLRQILPAIFSNHTYMLFECRHSMVFTAFEWYQSVGPDLRVAE